MTDLFDAVSGAPGDGSPEMPQPEPRVEPPIEENQVLAEVPAEPGAKEVIEENGDDAGPEDVNEGAEGDEPSETETAPAGAEPAEKKPEASKQVNVVEEDPYDFDKCLITVAMALMPDDGSQDGRKVMLGVRNHQDEPILTTCRLSDLMPLPDPVQQLIEQLKDQLPARSEKAAERKAKAEEAKKKAASKSKTTAKATPPAKAKKAEKPKPTSLNLFDMFDQPSQEEV
jgi:hypothetical protein